MVPPPFRLPVLYYPTKIAQAPAMPQSKKAIRQKFSSEEDQKLKDLVLELGESNWNEVANRIGTRTARQCRERFKNYLSPAIKNDPWTEEDNEKLRIKYAEYGPKWSQIAKFFPTRSEVNIKNHWTLLFNKNSREHDIKEEKRQLIQQIDMVIENTKRMSVPAPVNQVPQENMSFHLPSLPPPSSIVQPKIAPEHSDISDLLAQLTFIPDQPPNVPFESELGSIGSLGPLEWDNSDDQNSFLPFFEFNGFNF